MKIFVIIVLVLFGNIVFEWQWNEVGFGGWLFVIIFTSLWLVIAFYTWTDENLGREILEKTRGDGSSGPGGSGDSGGGGGCGGGE